MDSKNTHVSTLIWENQLYVTMFTSTLETCPRWGAYRVLEAVRNNPVYRGGCQPKLLEAISNIEDWKQWKQTVAIDSMTFTDKSSAAAFKNELIHVARRSSGYNVLNEYNANADRIERR